jgi:galactokinase
MSEPNFLEHLRQTVVRRYGARADEVRVVRSPYRICPLGAHIDHQRGLVTAMAIDRAVHVAYAPVAGEVRLSSLDFPGDVAFSLDHVPDRRDGDWGNFARGAVRALQQRGPLCCGIHGVTAGRLDGGGLSSSAAIGVALLLALEDVNSLAVSPQENIALDQAIENEYLGLRNGILDQSAILLSRRDHLTYLDCRTRQNELIPVPRLPEPLTVLIAFSGLKQALVGTDYNRRVDECRTAAATLLRALGRPDAEPVLRNIEPDDYARCGDVLEGPSARRAAHFFSEMQRVRAGVECWRRGDLTGFGRFVSASGESSIRNYECGCPPLVDLYEILISMDGVLGARFSGAGFRGCCLALVAAGAAEQVATTVLRRYRERQPQLAEQAVAFVCRTDDGARILASE